LFTKLYYLVLAGRSQVVYLIDEGVSLKFRIL